ncbi:sortase B [Lachnospiraceae bacterium]|nr:sortase B [Lachnospiraceae bacterium]
MSKRGVIRVIAILVAFACFGYLGYYVWNAHMSKDATQTVSVKKKGLHLNTDVSATTEVVTDSGEKRKLYILQQYQELYNLNKNLVGWIKIEGTKIDYPVMKSINGNGEYYLDHNMDQEEDRNGTLFMDDACDVIRPSENWIVYGHNMSSGLMFGELDSYKSESFYKNHPKVQFDTIYETGTYDVMFAFQSHVFQDTEIAFKYYQFIDPASSQEFYSGIEEMRAASYYDTGVTAKYGDRLLILSTCDYDESNGRFVVVCVREDDGGRFN